MNGRSLSISVLIRALRVYQWPKNLFVFAALVFAEQLGDQLQVFKSVVAFLVFCAASSATYVFNDMVDIENDRAHPEKCKRPLPSGELSIRSAIAMMVVLASAAVVVAWSLGPGFLAIVLFYMTLTALYTVALRNVVIIDVLVVAAGFVIRAMAGAIALHVAFSNWLVVCTLFLALFLGLSKRRHEVGLLEHKSAVSHRKVLQFYSLAYLDHLIVIVTAATVITYTIYTCSPEVVGRIGTDKLYLTLPFVIYGLFRYFHLVHFDDAGGDPTQTLFKDWPLVLTIVLYGLACVGIIYGAKLV